MKNKIQHFLLLNIGLIFVAAGISLFKTPNHFALGGVSGIAIIVSNFTQNLNVGALMFIVNALLVVMGFVFLGKNFGVATIYSSFALSFYVWVFEALVPLSAPLTNDTMLELAFAVILPAIGSGIVFNIGASTGGTDIVAMVLSKKIKMEIGKALLASDFIITVIAGMIFGVSTGLYCILGLVIKAFLIDVVIDNINTRKNITIVSSAVDDIKQFIIEKLNRGATIIDAKGAFSNDSKQVIVTILNRRQTVLLRNYIKTVDNEAFITITNSSEIIGKGFRQI